MLTVTKISSKKDFYNLRNDWNDLLSKSESNNIFLTWEWLYNWWEIFGYDKELKILLVKEDNKLIGIAPLYLSKDKKNIYHIKFLGSTHVGSDYLDFILQKGREYEIIFKILEYLDLNGNEWQIINLVDISAQSKSVKLIHKFSNNNFYLLIKKHNICPYISLPDSYDLFLNSLSSNMRYNIKKKRYKFKNEFGGHFVIIKDKAELDKSIEHLVKLNLSRTRMKNMKSPFSDKQFFQFHNNLIKSVFDKGWIRLCFLKVKDKFIACLYIFKYNQKYYYYQSGFDSEWAKLSPGFLLFSYCIENAILEGIKEFDFLRGREEFKYRWAKDRRINLQIDIYRKNLRNKILCLNEKFKILAKSRIKNIIYPTEF